MDPSQIEQLLVVSVMCIIALGTVLPLGWAIVRRVAAPKTGKAVALPASADTDRLDRMERAIEAIAVEVERITESQRFMTKLLAEPEPAKDALASSR